MIVYLIASVVFVVVVELASSVRIPRQYEAEVLVGL